MCDKNAQDGKGDLFRRGEFIMKRSEQTRSGISGMDFWMIAAAAAIATLWVVAATSAQAQTFTVIHSFAGSDGANPMAGMTMDAAGNLYGTTAYGGSYACTSGGCGTVFKLTHSQSGWVLSVLYQFRGQEDGDGPLARVVFGPDGALYGTTAYGNYNTVFKLQPPASICRSISCPWMKTILYTFDFEDQTTGFGPMGDLSFDGSGNIYGTNQYGGNTQYCNGPGCGLVYELTPSGGAWTENVLYAFQGLTDGAAPESGVILDDAGNLYGTAFETGTLRNNAGTVFELSPSSSGWTENTVYQFQGSSDGGYPAGGLIFDAAGNLYGSTTSGGSGDGGTVFELLPYGGGWNFNLLYSLTDHSDDTGPHGKLVRDSQGNLYGTTLAGGAHNWGSVFKLTPSDGGWTYTDLYDFTNHSDGAYPIDGLVIDASGNIYGTTEAADNSGQGCGVGLGCGVIFEITP
jgi:uncharacterized repeat protein (TIGR03803 family)